MSAPELAHRLTSRVATAMVVIAFVMPGVLALFVPWADASVEFNFLAATHLLGLGLATLCFAVLLRLFAPVASRSDSLSRMFRGIVGVSLVAGAGLLWMKGPAGDAGHPVLVIAQVLTVGLMLMVAGCVFELIRVIMNRGALAPGQHESEAAS